MKCLHITSGDQWAGAEVSGFHLMVELARRSGIEVAALLFNQGTMELRLREAGIPTWVLPESRLSSFGLVSEALSLFRKWRPDIIHSHRAKENLVGAALGAILSAAHIRTIHGLPAEFHWSRRWHGSGALLDRAAAGLADTTWIAVSEDLARRSAGLRRTVRVVPNGLPRVEPPADRRALDEAFAGAAGEQARYVGFVGRLERVKRPDRFLRVFSRLPARVGGTEIRGVMLGAGKLLPEVRALAAGAHLSSRVRILGHRDDAERILPALDLLLVPSDHEGHPMVVLEAMRSGVPVVASAVGGLVELAGASPWLVPPSEEDAMADAVARLLRDDAERARWAQELRARFQARFTIDRTADGVRAVYDEVVRDGAGAH